MLAAKSAVCEYDMIVSLSPFDILREFSSRNESRKEQFGKV